MGRPKTISDDELLKHARSVFLEKGASASTREIARRAGLSEAALFQRFPTKTRLFLAALVPPVVDVGAIFADAAAQPDARAALAGIGRRMLACFRGLIPTALHLMTHPSITIQDITAHFETAPAKVLTDGLVAYLLEAQSHGQLRVENPLATASLFMSAIHSLPLFEMMEVHGGKDLEHAVDLFVTALWSGLAPLPATDGTAVHS